MFKFKSPAVFCLSICFALASCGTDPGGENSITDNNGADPNGGGKGDTTVGIIVSLKCTAQNSFAEVGGFVEVDVDARDDEGALSRNYTLEVTPTSAARVVQRNKVIFDEPGAYDIKCISNDSIHTDVTTVMVGYTEPALSVNARSFVDGDRVRITGRAVGAENAPVWVEVDGYIPELADDGSFDVTMDATEGRLNRYYITATDNQGRTSDRNVFVVAGEFGDLQEPTSDAVRVALGPQVYPELASLVERVISGLPAGQTERSDNLEFQELLSPESGSNLGIDWIFDPLGVGSTPPNVTLTPVANGIQVDVVFDQAYIDAHIITGDEPDTTERDLRGEVQNLTVSALLRVNGPDDLGIENVLADWDDLDVDITSFPNWVVDLFVFFLEGKFKKLMRDGIENAGNKALVGVLEGFGVEKTFDLPEPLVTTMTTTSSLSTLVATTNGLDVGLSFGIDGETDPLRADAPGPLRFPDRSTGFGTHDGYQVALALEPMNDLMFAAWQTAALDITLDFERGIVTPQGTPEVTSIIVFAEPALPPVIAATDTPGVFELNIGGVRVDAVFETTLGMANVAAVLGADATIRLSGDGSGFDTEVSLDDLYVDVLVAPFSLEREAIEAILEDNVIPQLMPDLASVVGNFPIPEADLTALEVGLSTLAIENVAVTQAAPTAALSLSADVIIE